MSIGKEILPDNAVAIPFSREQKAVLYKIGSGLREEFTERNADISTTLHEIGADNLYIVNKLVVAQLHDILANEKSLREEFEETEGRAESQLEAILRRKDKQETSGIFRFLDVHSEYLVHLRMIDWLLGIQEINESLELPRRQYGNEQFEYQGTPYEFIADFLHALDLGAEDVLYDLGSGYGRIPLYAALTTGCGKCKGIEIVPERVAVSQNAARSLLLLNTEFIQGNVLDCDFSDGTIFFLFNPFTWQTLEKVGEKFKKIASRKSIQIITWGGPSVAYLERQSWLKPRLVYVKELTRPMSWGLYIFESLK